MLLFIVSLKYKVPLEEADKVFPEQIKDIDNITPLANMPFLEEKNSA